VDSPSFKKKLIHQATFLAGSISRDAAGDIVETWSPIDNDTGGTVVGRLVFQRHEIANPWQGFMMRMEPVWLCDSANDEIEEEHRLRNIVNLDGSDVPEGGGTWDVSALIPRYGRKLHHYKLTLKKVE